MTMPHTCRCEKCGAEGTIIPTSMFDATAAAPEIVVRSHRGIPQGSTCTDNDCGCHDPSQARYYNTPPEGVERRAIVPTETSPYASSRADELAPRGEPPYAEIATCTHGYTRCMPCKFPAP